MHTVCVYVYVYVNIDIYICTQKLYTINTFKCAILSEWTFDRIKFDFFISRIYFFPQEKNTFTVSCLIKKNIYHYN